jgi:hypothetical protein
MLEHPGYDPHVADTTLENMRVSTVCLISDMRHMRRYECGAPIVFETALFANGQFVSVLDRYATYDEAEQGHCGWCDAIGVRLLEQRVLGSDNGD